MCSLFRSTLHTVILDISNSQLTRCTDFFGLRRKECLIHSALSSDTRGRSALFPLQRHPVVWNCWYQCLMLLGDDGGSLLNCGQNTRWTETNDSCFTNCSTHNAFCSGVTIIALLHHRLTEKRGVGLRKSTKLEHLLFRSMWETYFCMRFESCNGILKMLQSLWYTSYNILTIFLHGQQWTFILFFTAHNTTFIDNCDYHTC